MPPTPDASATLDAFDRKILAILQQDARVPAEAIGAAIGLSASAVQRRIARLRSTGTIVAEVAVVAPKAVGRPLSMVVDIEVSHERPEHMATLRRWLATEPAIQQAWFVTGESDAVLVVTAPDLAAFEAVMQRLLADNTHVSRYRTRVVMATVKQSLAVPVDGQDGA